MYEPGRLKLPLPLRIQSRFRILGKYREQERSTGPQNPIQFAEPRILHGLVQVRKYRKAIDNVEIFGRIRQRRVGRVG